MHADTITTWSGLHPDTPHQCVSAQCGFQFSSVLPRRSARYARSSTWGERDHLSHVVGDPGVVLWGMSRQIALKRAQKLSDARNGF